LKKPSHHKPNTYASAGVNLNNSVSVKEHIKKIAQKTYGTKVVGGVGGFGAMYRLAGLKDPILVSSTDPVGTKLMLAGMYNDFSAIGVDLVNACVNDLIVVGATPLFFLDYIATSRMNPDIVTTIVESIAITCLESECALIGGETAEMPGVFTEGNFDISGFIVGVVESEDMLRPHDNIQTGDVLIGVPSNGLHTNGYSLVRHIFNLDQDVSILSEYMSELGDTLGKTLLIPHRSYFDMFREIYKDVKGIAHITGGGLYENIPRMLPDKCSAILYSSDWTVPAIFKVIQEHGTIDEKEMFRVFNMGLGMVIACDSSKVGKITNHIPDAVIVGEIVESNGKPSVIIK
jgi:phosphoribosylformylglycinamidine cyclo-ligase